MSDLAAKLRRLRERQVRWANFGCTQAEAMALIAVAEAAQDVYEHDDAFCGEARDDVVNRDAALGDALAALSRALEDQ